MNQTEVVFLGGQPLTGCYGCSYETIVYKCESYNETVQRGQPSERVVKHRNHVNSVSYMNIQGYCQYFPLTKNTGNPRSKPETCRTSVYKQTTSGRPKSETKSPVIRSSQGETKGRYTSSLSILQKEKDTQSAVLPTIDKDIVELTGRSVSPESLVEKLSARTQKPDQEERARKGTRFVACLRTSLSTEWKNGSKSSSSEGECNLPKSQPSENISVTPGTISTATMEDNPASEKNLEADSECIRFIVPQIPKHSGSYAFKRNVVSIQTRPRRRCITSNADTTKQTSNHRQHGFANFNLSSSSTRRLPNHQERPRQQLVARKKRVLPKSLFKVKSQKAAAHRSITVVDPGNQARNSCSTRSGRISVVVQQKQKLKPFTIQAKTPQ